MTKTKLISFAVLALGLAAAVSSCKKESKPDPTPVEVTFTVTGKITDQDSNSPIAGATITVGDVTATSANDGSYKVTIPEVTSTVKITASADKYADRTANLAAKDFTDKAAVKDFALQFKGGIVTGKVLNDIGTAGIKGADVTLGNAKTTTIDDGSYKFEDLVLDDYTVQITYNGETVERAVAKADFVDGTATVATAFFGSTEILPFGLTRNLLLNAPLLYENEYIAGACDGTIGEGYEYNDTHNIGNVTQAWLTANFVKMSMQGNSGSEADFYASNQPGSELKRNRTNVLQTSEGLSLRSRFMKTDPDNYASYVYARKNVTADNCVMSLQVDRIFAVGDYESQENYKLHVNLIDLTQDKLVLDEKVITISRNALEGTEIVTVDLSAYVGKQIGITIGVKQPVASDNHKKCYFNVCIRYIGFAKTAVTDNFTLPGTAAQGAENFAMTKENVASMTIVPAGTYSGEYNSAFIQTYVDEMMYPFDYTPYLGSAHIYNHFGYRYFTASPDSRAQFTLRAVKGDASAPCAYVYAKIAAGGTFAVDGNASNIACGFVVIPEDGSAATVEAPKAVNGVQSLSVKAEKTSVVCFAVYPKDGETDGSMTVEKITIK